MSHGSSQARALRTLAGFTLLLALVGWVVREMAPPTAVAGDPVQSMRAARAEHGSLPWATLRLGDLGPACDGGDLSACRDLGGAYEDFHRETADWGFDLPPCLGHQLLVRACDGRDFAACHRLGWHARDGRCEARDEGLARERLRLACTYGRIERACHDLEWIERG